jgi:hypothetical protein
MNDHNEDWQKALLGHPAYKNCGVDASWRIIAIIGWLLSFFLMIFQR